MRRKIGIRYKDYVFLKMKNNFLVTEELAIINRSSGFINSKFKLQFNGNESCQ